MGRRIVENLSSHSRPFASTTKARQAQTARADLLAIVDYISDDNPDAAQHLKDDIEAKAFRLPDHPQLYRVGREPGTREMVVRSNYVVVCAEDARAVTILRVLHAAQQWPAK